MSESGDHAYFLERARRERAISGDCADPGAALVHRRLAEEYERRAAALAPQYETPRAAWPHIVERLS